jgi:hypothetical protein
MVEDRSTCERSFVVWRSGDNESAERFGLDVVGGMLR